MKRHFLLISLTFAILIGSFSTLATASTPSMTQMEEMIKIVEEENLQLTEWELLLKDRVDRTQFSTFKKKVKLFFPNSSFIKEKTEKATKLTVNYHDEKNAIFENFIIMIPDNHDYPVEASYKLSGKGWSNQIVDQYSSKLVSMTKELFTKDLTDFSCVRAMSGDKMNRVYFFKKLQRKLSVQSLTHIQENEFVVLSGYTPHWESEIPGINGPMNIQLAAREVAGGQTAITIGTPIIMTEY